MNIVDVAENQAAAIIVWPYQALPGNAEDMDHQMQLLISRSQQLSKPPPLHLLAYAAFLPNGCVSFEEFGGP